jgi:hypothetical protein
LLPAPNLRLAPKASKALRGHKGKKVSKAHRDRKALKASKGFRGRKGRKERTENKVLPGHKDRKVRKAKRASRVQLVKLAQQVLPAQQACMWSGRITARTTPAHLPAARARRLLPSHVRAERYPSQRTGTHKLPRAATARDRPWPFV